MPKPTAPEPRDVQQTLEQAFGGIRVSAKTYKSKSRKGRYARITTEEPIEGTLATIKRTSVHKWDEGVEPRTLIHKHETGDRRKPKTIERELLGKTEIKWKEGKGFNAEITIRKPASKPVRLKTDQMNKKSAMAAADLISRGLLDARDFQKAEEGLRKGPGTAKFREIKAKVDKARKLSQIIGGTGQAIVMHDREVGELTRETLYSEIAEELKRPGIKKTLLENGTKIDSRMLYKVKFYDETGRAMLCSIGLRGVRPEAIQRWIQAVKAAALNGQLTYYEDEMMQLGGVSLKSARLGTRKHGKGRYGTYAGNEGPKGMNGKRVQVKIDTTFQNRW